MLISSSKLVYLRCVGGEVGATSSLAPKIGPLGLVSVSFIFLFVDRHCCLMGLSYAHPVPADQLSIRKWLKNFLSLSFSRQRKSVMTSPRQPVTGRVWRSPSVWQFKTDKLPFQWYHQPLHWLSRLWRNRHVTARRSRIVSDHRHCPNERSN